MDSYTKRYNRRANTNSRKNYRNESLESYDYILNTDIWYQSHLIPKTGENLTTVMNLANNATYASIVRKHNLLQLSAITGSQNCFFHESFKSCIPEYFTASRDYRVRIYDSNDNEITRVNYDIDYSAGVLMINATATQIASLFGSSAPKVSFWKYIGGTMEDIFVLIDTLVRKAGDFVDGVLIFDDVDSGINITECAVFSPYEGSTFYNDIDMNSYSINSIRNLEFRGETGIRIASAGNQENINIGYGNGYGSQDCIIIGNSASVGNTSSIGAVVIGSYAKRFNNNAYTIIGHGAGNTLASISDGDIIFGSVNKDLIRANVADAHFSPSSNSAVDLGLALRRWKSIYSDELFCSYIEPSGIDTGVTVGGDFTVYGDFTVLGEQVIMNTQTVEIEDNILRINKNLSGLPPADLTSGIEINRGTSPDYFFLFRELDDSFVIGEASSLQKVATREDNPLNNALTFWDDSEKKIATNANLTYTDSVFTVGAPVLTLNAAQSGTPATNLFTGIEFARGSGDKFRLMHSEEISSLIYGTVATPSLVLTTSGQIWNNRIPIWDSSTHKVTSNADLTYENSKLNANALLISGLTASKFVATDANKNLVSRDLLLSDIDTTTTVLSCAGLILSDGADTRIPYFNSSKRFITNSSFTYANSKLNTNAMLISGLTASKFVATDANKNLISRDIIIGDIDISTAVLSCEGITLSDGVPGQIPFFNPSKRLMSFSSLTYDNSRLNTNALAISGLTANKFVATNSDELLVSRDIVIGDIPFSGSNITMNSLTLQDHIDNGVLYFDSNGLLRSNALYKYTDSLLTLGGPMITLNTILTGAPSTGLITGIDFERGTSENYRLAFYETDDTLRFGALSELRLIPTVPTTMPANSIPIWDSTNKVFTSNANLTYASSRLNANSIMVSGLTASKFVATDSNDVLVSRDIVPADINFSSTTLTVGGLINNAGVDTRIPFYDSSKILTSSDTFHFTSGRLNAPAITTTGSAYFGNFNWANRVPPMNIGINNSTTAYAVNTDPTDTRRIALYTLENTGVSASINIGFDISPQSTFLSSRCMGDLRFRRPLGEYRLGIFTFSAMTSSTDYSDLLHIGTSSSFPNGSLSVGSSTPATILANGRLTIANTTASSSTTSGCATFAGGIGVNGASVIREPTTIGRTTFRANNQLWYINEETSNWHGFRFGVPAGSTPRVYFGDLNGTTNTTIYAGGYVPFSGCHVVKNVGPELSEADIGKLFMLDGTNYKPTEILNGYANGRLCDQEMSKAVYGVICDANYLDQDGNSNGEVLLLSVGEGGCLVHDDSGTVDIECGDILVSRADGYARKLEDSEFTVQTLKYTVGRARETYSGPSPYLLHISLMCG